MGCIRKHRVERAASSVLVAALWVIALSGCSSAADSARRSASGGAGAPGDITGAAASNASHTSTGGASSVITATTGSGGRAMASATDAGPTMSPPGNATDAGRREPCGTQGATRACCGSGTQTCSGLEFSTWGPCLDRAGSPLSCNACGPGEFGPGCDAGVDAGKPHDAGSDSGHPPPPDAGRCGSGMACKPGSIRYCDTPLSEWSLATCTASGQWGTCVATTVPAGAVGIGDCSPTDYSPEMCCPQLHLCCQNDPTGPFVDFGSGACAEVSCP